jgi:hypothetical protein
MIANREQLIHVLTEAAEVEHNLLCSYLYAMFSLKRAGEPGLTAKQGDAVERWRKTILSVALEEMAHLACVNNLLLAVGGAPHLDRPNLPAAPGYHPAGIVVRLTPFSPETLDHFIFLERPPTDPRRDADGFDVQGVARNVDRSAVTPSAPDYETIGELYDDLSQGFSALCALLGEADFIDQTGAGQLSAKASGLRDVSVVTNLSEALATLETIKEQGEGASDGREDSHYRRFIDIKTEWADLSKADASFEPAWPAASDPVMRKPAADVDRAWITDPSAAGVLDLANAAYGAMLVMLSQVFGNTDAEDQAASMSAAIQLMEIAAALGAELARSRGVADGAFNAGLSFAVPRNLGWRPSRKSAHTTELVERLRLGIEATIHGADKAKLLAKVEKLSSSAHR